MTRHSLSASESALALRTAALGAAAANPGCVRVPSWDPSAAPPGPETNGAVLAPCLEPFPETDRACERDRPELDRATSRRSGAAWRTNGSVARRAAGAASTGAALHSRATTLACASCFGELSGSPVASLPTSALLAASDIRNASTVAWRSAAAAASASPPRAGRLGRRRLDVRARCRIASAPRFPRGEP